MLRVTLLALVLAGCSAFHAPSIAHRRLAFQRPRTAAPAIKAALLAPADTFEYMANEGLFRCDERKLKLFVKSIAAGAFVGTGGILCAGVGGDIGASAFWEVGNGVKRFVFGAIGFPLSIIAVGTTGASAFTGNLAFAGAALRAGKTSLYKVGKMLLVTYIGCLLGTFLAASLCALGALPAVGPSVSIAVHKLALSPLQTFIRGIGGGWLIALAITFATASTKGGGNFCDLALGVWLPISTYVICDFEHCLANMFFFFVALISGQGAQLGAMPVIYNLLYSTLGNIVGAGVIVGIFLQWATGPNCPVDTVRQAFGRDTPAAPVAPAAAWVPATTVATASLATVPAAQPAAQPAAITPTEPAATAPAAAEPTAEHPAAEPASADSAPEPRPAAEPAAVELAAEPAATESRFAATGSYLDSL
ncbi:Formate/nitrite transporter-domain-containing protein [Pavlovales sp. CCMP2436]|nr:Formate/nitrite transporter-domain-containing protein [Pavlovales sp. CCMP2436]